MRWFFSVVVRIKLFVLEVLR